MKKVPYRLPSNTMQQLNKFINQGDVASGISSPLLQGMSNGIIKRILIANWKYRESKRYT